VCLIASFWRAFSGAVVIQHTIASMSWVTSGWFPVRAIMSPRLTSTSSARRTVTDMGGKASGTSSSNRSIASIVEVIPLGRTTTSSPGLSTPPATCPAYPR
jgi:hypothetical protein